MPNHYHLLAQELTQNALPKYINDIMNSFTRYYNLKHERKGPIFLPNTPKKAVFTENTLLHVIRYIHLNPYVAELVHDVEKLTEYPFSSHQSYLKENDSFIDTSIIMGLFNNQTALYQEFIEEQAGYQKSLNLLTHV